MLQEKFWKHLLARCNGPVFTFHSLVSKKSGEVKTRPEFLLYRLHLSMPRQAPHHQQAYYSRS